MTYSATQAIDRELKKGSAELLILFPIEHRTRHGYQIGKLMNERSEGVLKYNVASFYPLLYRLEARGLIEGRWIEKVGQRRRRYYKLTTKGKKMLQAQRSTWANLVNAGTAKRSVSRTRHRILWVGLWVENTRENCPERYLARTVLGLRSAPTTGA